MENIELHYVLLSILGGFIFGEFVGYVIHVLLHSNKVKYLSKSHMIHHLKIYGPKMPQITDKYKIAVKNRLSVAGIGFEWIIPVGSTLIITFLGAHFLGIYYIYTIIFLAMGIIWGGILFGYMHNALHLKNFWMIKNKFFKKWFMNARNLHIIHHVELTNDGRMNKNFGICFFIFDRIFGTFSNKYKGSINEKGFKAAEKRYDYILKMDF